MYCWVFKWESGKAKGFIKLNILKWLYLAEGGNLAIFCIQPKNSKKNCFHYKMKTINTKVLAYETPYSSVSESFFPGHFVTQLVQRIVTSNIGENSINLKGFMVWDFVCLLNRSYFIRWCGKKTLLILLKHGTNRMYMLCSWEILWLMISMVTWEYSSSCGPMVWFLMKPLSFWTFSVQMNHLSTSHPHVKRFLTLLLRNMEILMSSAFLLLSAQAMLAY